MVCEGSEYRAMKSAIKYSLRVYTCVAIPLLHARHRATPAGRYRARLATLNARRLLILNAAATTATRREGAGLTLGDSG